MKQLLLIGSLLALPLAGQGEPPAQTWDYAAGGGMPENWSGLAMAPSGDVRTPDGQPTLDCVPGYDSATLEWAAHLRYAAPAALARNAGTAKISFWIKGEAGTRISVRVTRADSAHLTATQAYDLAGKWQRIEFQEPFLDGLVCGRWIDAPRLLFDKARPGQHFFVGPVAFTVSGPDDCAKAVPADPPGWKPLDTGGLYIQPGSALDFSPFFEQAPAGSHGRVVVNPEGALAFASRPETPVRFFSVQLVPPPDLRQWSDRDIADYAAAVARQGYNLARFHFFDNFINGNDRAPARKAAQLGRYVLPEKPEEIVYDARALDRFHLLLAELKKHGVYWNVDFMTSFAGYANGQVGSVPTQGAFNTKVQMYVNPNFRANWKAAASRLLDDVNPYTGMPLKDDPALALTTCLNEQELLFEQRDYGHELDGPWHTFLAEKYGDYGKLRAAWKGTCGDAVLPEGGSFADLPPIAAPTVLSDTPAGRDMAACCGRMEYEMTQYYLQTLHELGFPGLVSNWNMRTRVGTVPARSLLPVVTMNAYHAHPRFGAATQVDQRSALADGGSSFKNQAVARFLDRPFVNTECGIVFWNPYRHEQGLLYGAGAALQDWSGLNCHAGQVVESGAPLLWFHAGDDPVIRASEAVEALAFRRGDIAASPHAVEIPLSDAFIQAGRGMKAIDDELSRLWVLCRVGITYGPRRADYPKSLSVAPDKTSAIGGSVWFSAVAASDSTSQLSAIVARLREAKVLPASNRSDPARGLLQSDTGEVTLDTAAGGELFVHAPRLEGAVLKSDRKAKLDALTIEACTVPASVTVASLEAGHGVRDASRLLLVFSTDARNRGMTFADATEETLANPGTLPVLARTGELRITLARSGPALNVKAYALRLDGERAEEIPVAAAGQTLSLDIDTARLAQAGPTPFFEIVDAPDEKSALP